MGRGDGERRSGGLPRTTVEKKAPGKLNGQPADIANVEVFLDTFSNGHLRAEVSVVVGLRCVTTKGGCGCSEVAIMIIINKL